MTRLWAEIRRTPLLWLLPFVPAVLLAEHLGAEQGAMLFVLSVLAIVPLAALLSRATEAVAEKTGDAVGGLLNATLGNLAELVIALTALQAGQYMLVKATIAGAIVGNSLFMLGMCFLLGGLRHREQMFNSAAARLQASLLFVAVVALLVPSTVADMSEGDAPRFVQILSLILSFMLIAVYALGLLFSLKTHRAVFQAVSHEADGVQEQWPIGLAVGTLAGVTILVALVSEVFVASVEVAATTVGMSHAFVGFVVVALVGASAEMASAFAAARRDRLDLSIAIALGSATQIALFVAPVLVLASYLIGPSPMTLQFWVGAVAMMMLAALTAALVTIGGRSAWFTGVLVLAVYLIFAVALYLLPPATAAASSPAGHAPVSAPGG
jgi:Ca2+:H+ antiporter